MAGDSKAQLIEGLNEDLKGEFQAVIKPLGQIFRGIKGISGSTILGDGSVALILDVATLIALAERSDQRSTGIPLNH